MADYPNALLRATKFDAQVDSDAKKISADYASIVALSIRQAFAATEITVSRKPDSSYDTSNVLTFMKGASSAPPDHSLLLICCFRRDLQ